MKVQLRSMTQDPIKLVADIAVICHGRDAAKNPERLFKSLYYSGHHSVFEYINFVFRIDGISRACANQLTRHRHCVFTQRSQRYCKEDGFEYVTPPSLESEAAYGARMGILRSTYEDMVAEGIPKEDARYVLPNACTTSLYVGCNLRELIHVFNERSCTRAQWEIRQLMAAIKATVPEELHWMLVPKCKSGILICNAPCEAKKK
jgi:thymidylate synthase (FAD)